MVIFNPVDQVYIARWHFDLSDLVHNVNTKKRTFYLWYTLTHEQQKTTERGGYWSFNNLNRLFADQPVTIPDSSGVLVTYTLSPVTHSAGMMELGKVVSPGWSQLIPDGEQAFTATSYCSPRCMNWVRSLSYLRTAHRAVWTGYVHYLTLVLLTALYELGTFII